MSEIWSLKGQITLAHLSWKLTDAFGARDGCRGDPMDVAARSRRFAGWGPWQHWGNNGGRQRTWHDVRSTDPAIGGGPAGTAHLGSIATPVVRKDGNVWSLQTQNALARVLGRVKDLGRFVVRYEKLAINSLTAIHLASLIYCWF